MSRLSALAPRRRRRRPRRAARCSDVSRAAVLARIVATPSRRLSCSARSASVIVLSALTRARSSRTSSATTWNLVRLDGLTGPRWAAASTSRTARASTGMMPSLSRSRTPPVCGGGRCGYRRTGAGLVEPRLLLQTRPGRVAKAVRRHGACPVGKRRQHGDVSESAPFEPLQTPPGPTDLRADAVNQDAEESLHARAVKVGVATILTCQRPKPCAAIQRSRSAESGSFSFRSHHRGVPRSPRWARKAPTSTRRTSGATNTAAYSRRASGTSSRVTTARKSRLGASRAVCSRNPRPAACRAVSPGSRRPPGSA